jgi:hypothetical protein
MYFLRSLVLAIRKPHLHNITEGNISMTILELTFIPLLWFQVNKTQENCIPDEHYIQTLLAVSLSLTLQPSVCLKWSMEIYQYGKVSTKIFLLLSKMLCWAVITALSKTNWMTNMKNKGNKTFKSTCWQAIVACYNFLICWNLVNVVDIFLTIRCGHMGENRCKKWRQKLNGEHWHTPGGKTLKVEKDGKDGILSPSTLQMPHLKLLQIFRYIAPMSKDCIQYKSIQT